MKKRAKTSGLISNPLSKEKMNKVLGGKDAPKDDYGTINNPVQLGDVVVYPK